MSSAPRRLLIYGSGDLGHSVLRIARLLDLTVIGFLDDTREPGEYVHGIPIVGPGDRAGSECAADPDLGVILAIGYRRFDLRAARYDALVASGARIASCIHPAAHIDPDALISPGLVAFSGVIVEHGCLLHDNVVLQSGAVICHDVVVDRHAYISPSATLAGFVTVERCAWVGLGAKVLERRTIGRGAVVAAGAVVRDDVEPFTMVAGVPAEAKKRNPVYDCGL